MGVDPESYLRAVFEDAVERSGPLVPGSDAVVIRDAGGRVAVYDSEFQLARSRLLEAGRSLVAVGAVDAARAQAVVDECILVAAHRIANEAQRRMAVTTVEGREPQCDDAGVLELRRVVRCHCEIKSGRGTWVVHRVVLSPESTIVTVGWLPGSSAADEFASGSGRPPSVVTIADDRGNSSRSVFHRQASGGWWDGQLVTDRALAPDTSWLEIYGARVDLNDPPSEFEVSIEPLRDARPAVGYLWRRIASIERFHDPQECIEVAIDALVAVGALDRDEPELADVRAVQNALPRHPVMAKPPGEVDRLPAPWRSVLSRLGFAGGPRGSIVIAAATPPFDGFTVAVNILESMPDRFNVNVDVAPGLDHRPQTDTSVRPRSLTWWAADDRGNHYLGQSGQFGGRRERSSGEIAFWPALDPDARSIRIMPSSETTRAVIAGPLDWARQHTPPSAQPVPAHSGGDAQANEAGKQPSPESPRADAVPMTVPDETRFAWFTTWVNQHLCATVTFAKDRSWQEMIEGFGLSPAAVTNETYDEATADLGTKVRAGVTGRWGYAVEDVSLLGSNEDVLARLSANDGEAIALVYTQTINTFLYAADGKLVSGFDLTVPHIRYGPEQHRFDEEMQRAGFLPGVVPDPPSMGARLLEIAFGITLDQELLEKRLPTAPV